jgi:hypothetical protein
MAATTRVHRCNELQQTAVCGDEPVLRRVVSAVASRGNFLSRGAADEFGLKELLASVQVRQFRASPGAGRKFRIPLLPKVGEDSEYAAIVLGRFLDSELREGPSDMGLDGLRAKPKRARDALVRAPLGHQGKDLPFTRR